MSYASEDQRNDSELNAAVLAKLIKHREELKVAIESMRQASNILYETDDLHEGWGHESHHVRAKRNLTSDIVRMEWFIRHILSNVGSDTSAYVGNVAAFLSPGKANKLKREYREGKI